MHLTKINQKVFYPQSSFFVGIAKIYALSDNNGSVFYIGCTIKSLDERKGGHIRDAKYNNGNKKKNEIIRSLNYDFIITQIDQKYVTARWSNDTVSQSLPLERYWIAKYEEMGADLCNISYAKASKKAA